MCDTVFQVIVEELSECQPYNPFTELLFLEQHADIIRLLIKIDSKRYDVCQGLTLQSPINLKP